MIDEQQWELRMEEAIKKVHKPQEIPWKAIRRVNLEPTTLCNSSCIMCDHDNYFKCVGHQELSIKDIESFLVELSTTSKIFFGGLTQINFGVYCEPLMYPNIVQAVEIARPLALQRRISTNAMLLSSVMSINLLDAGLNRICFSIDEYEKEPLEKIRRGMIWEDILENTKNFKRIRDEGGYDCKIVVSPTIIKENSHRAKDIVKFWKKTLGVVVVPSPEVPVGRLIRVQPWFDNIGIPPCKDMFTIKADGKVVPCCMDVYGDSVLGDMFTDRVMDILKGEPLKKLRHQLATHTDLPFCCKICTYLPQFLARKQTLTDKLIYQYEKYRRLFNVFVGVPRN